LKDCKCKLKTQK